MSKIFVIAGTREEAMRWAKLDLERSWSAYSSRSMSDYVYVSDVTSIKGYGNPHGVFVGNWLGRPDIFEIVEALMLASTHVNPALGKIYSDLKPKVRPVRPTPLRLKPTSEFIEEAANLLSKSIDEQVLKDMGI